jgi:DNA-directed RNA polymerase subunit H (RpoH/RPB5)
MEYFLPYRIYQNLYKFLSYRKLTLVSGDLTKISKNPPLENGLLEQSDFAAMVQYSGYIMLEAKDAEGKIRKKIRDMHESTRKRETKTIIVLLDQHSNYITAAQYFSKLLHLIPNIKNPDIEYNMDIIIVPYEYPGSNITNKLLEYISTGDTSKGYIRFMIYEYNYFMSVKMESVSVCPSRILSAEEAKEIPRELHTKPINMKKMRVVDVVAVWLGAEVGDIIEEEIPSEATGIEKNYRFVKP